MSDNKSPAFLSAVRLPRMTKQDDRLAGQRSAAAIEAEKVISPATFESAKAAASRELSSALAKLAAEGGR